jgi:hypothetical protein
MNKQIPAKPKLVSSPMRHLGICAGIFVSALDGDLGGKTHGRWWTLMRAVLGGIECAHWVNEKGPEYTQCRVPLRRTVSAPILLRDCLACIASRYFPV